MDAVAQILQIRSDQKIIQQPPVGFSTLDRDELVTVVLTHVLAFVPEERLFCLTSLKNFFVEANRDNKGMNEKCGVGNNPTNHVKRGKWNKSCVLYIAEDKCLTS